MTLSELIVDYCDKQGITKTRFAHKCNLSDSYMTMLVRNVNFNTGAKIQPKIETYQAIAKGMGITVEELFERMDDAPLDIDAFKKVSLYKLSELKRNRIPIIGAVAGGQPIYDEDIDLYTTGPTKATCAVRLRGDSMEPTYIDGDLIYVKEQPDVLDGQVAIVFLDSEAVLKRVYHTKDGLQLLSDNPKYKPISATGEEYESIRILGIPCGYTRMYN